MNLARTLIPWVLACCGWLGGHTAGAAETEADIAKKLSNPVSDLISVPLQLNYDQDIGAGDQGERWLLNVQPVIPFSISENWNLISRTIIPVVGLDDVPPGNDESGIGDVFQSVFFSPKAPTESGWIWGVGPALLLPTASDDLLGTGKWAVGPTAVALKQANGWTYGALVNHVWSFAGDDDRADVSNSLLQPFLSYTTSRLTTFSVNTESTYNWETKQWSVPINLAASQLFKVGQQPMSLQLGLRYWADSPASGPEGWGVRMTYTLVIPK